MKVTGELLWSSTSSHSDPKGPRPRGRCHCPSETPLRIELISSGLPTSHRASQAQQFPPETQSPGSRIQVTSANVTTASPARLRDPPDTTADSQHPLLCSWTCREPRCSVLSIPSRQTNWNFNTTLLSSSASENSVRTHLSVHCPLLLS